MFNDTDREIDVTVCSNLNSNDCGSKRIPARHTWDTGYVVTVKVRAMGMCEFGGASKTQVLDNQHGCRALVYHSFWPDQKAAVDAAKNRMVGLIK